MLEQEGLSEIARSNASEQIAYLLVERTALLEKLEAAAEPPDPRGRADGLCAAQVPRLPLLRPARREKGGFEMFMEVKAFLLSVRTLWILNAGVDFFISSCACVFTVDLLPRLA